MATEYLKINKVQARKMYNVGTPIYLLPANVGLNSIWVHPLEITNKHDVDNYTNFDKRVNEYSFYNCCTELGRYAKYFIKLGTQ